MQDQAYLLVQGSMQTEPGCTQMVQASEQHPGKKQSRESETPMSSIAQQQHNSLGDLGELLHLGWGVCKGHPKQILQCRMHIYM